MPDQPPSTDDADAPIGDETETLIGPSPELQARLDALADSLGGGGRGLRRVGDYRLGDCLGAGGMGAVYRGRHVELGHEVAVKLFRPHGLADAADRVERFYQEARTAAAIRHPNLVSVHQVGQCGDEHFLVMDLVEGPTLAATIDAEPLAWERAVDLVRSVVEGVASLHAAGIVHRDLKPANVLLDGNGVPHVTDFGLAKLLGNADRMTQDGAIVGTPRYMAPEQARGEPVTAASDLFAVGAIFYELLTGRPAFAGDHPMESLRRVIESEPPSPRSVRRDIPADVQRVCLRCLAKSPSNRYRTASELVADLKRVRIGEPPITATVNPTAAIRRQFRRSPDLWMRTVGLATVITLLQANHWRRAAYSPIHGPVMATLAGWLGLSVLLWAVHTRTSRWRLSDAGWLPLAWSAVDVAFLTVLLSLSAEASATFDSVGPLLVGYAVLIAASGFWLRRDAVWLTTALSIAGYALVRARQSLAAEPPQYPVLVVVALTLVGLAVAQQVYRIRWISLADRNDLRSD